MKHEINKNNLSIHKIKKKVHMYGIQIKNTQIYNLYRCFLFKLSFILSGACFNQVLIAFSISISIVEGDLICTPPMHIKIIVYNLFIINYILYQEILFLISFNSFLSNFWCCQTYGLSQPSNEAFWKLPSYFFVLQSWNPSQVR